MCRKYFVIGVKHWLTHLILVLFAVVFFDGTAKADATIWEEDTEASFANVDAGDAACFLSDTDWNFPPRQLSLAHSSRVKHVGQRTTNTQRYQGGFYRFSKLADAGYCKFISNKSFISYSFFIKLAHRLISLGKLII